MLDVFAVAAGGFALAWNVVVFARAWEGWRFGGGYAR